ncbi:MAG: DUF1566 domain-containing protein [Betaproteobacteria bacterium]|nr:MAG: DUF1566 domain-containing protein [Betaproteobacteria bacterium]
MNSTRQHKATRAIAALTVIASTAVGVIHAACWDTSTPPKPTSQYNLLGPAGTVVDTATQLMWKQCVEGKSGSGCATGTVSFMRWADANTAASGSTWAGYNDWRLPLIGELQSLVASACFSPDPTINAEAFPATPPSFVWSGSPYAGNSSDAWYVNFSNGYSNFNVRSYAYRVRLVRGGQRLSLLAPTAQTLTFSTPAPTLPFNGTSVVAATSGAPNSANPVVYASTTPAVCTVDASTGTVSLTNAAQVGNTCTISANQFGRIYNSQNYAPATQITQTLVVSQGAQSVAFAASPAVNVGETGTVVATSNQGITPVSFSSNTPSVCTVSGTNNSTVTGVAVGTCSITASSPANTNYLPATATQTFSIGLGSQTLSFGVVPSITAGGSGSVTATSDRALTPVTLTSATSSVCTISSGTVNGLIAGTCTIQAAQLGSSDYSPASASLSFPINAATQTLSFAAALTINVGSTGTVTATSNQALSTVTLTSATLPVCTISNGTVSGVSAGTCTINAAAPSGASYLAATASLSFGVGIGSPTLTFGAVPLITVGSTGNVSVASDKSATPVSLTSSTPTCTIASGVVTGVSTGVCTLQATQPAASSYSAGSASLSFNIGAAPLVCNLHMDGTNPMLATVEGLILTRAMLGLKGSAVTDGTGITTPWDTIRVDLNAKCGTAFLP